MDEITPSNSFYKVTLALVTKLETDSTKVGSYISISLMNVEGKMFNKMLENSIQQQKKEGYTP